MRHDAAGRRAALLALGAVGLTALSACAARPSRTPRPRASPTSIIAPPRPSASTQPSGAPTAVPIHSPASAGPPRHPAPSTAPPDLDALAAGVAGRTPTAWGTDLPGIRRTLDAPYDADGAARIALTFDACGGSRGRGYDSALIEGLMAAQVPATLFLNSRWISANTAVAAQLIGNPLFSIGNHGTAHVPLSVTGRAAYDIPGTGSAREALDEVWGNHENLRLLTGRPPTMFRAGTAHYDDIAVGLVRALGEQPVGFSVNGDGGATYSAATVRSEVGTATAGAIVLAHMNQPSSGTAAGMLRAIGDLRARGVRFVHVDA